MCLKFFLSEIQSLEMGRPKKAVANEEEVNPAQQPLQAGDVEEQTVQGRWVVFLKNTLAFLIS